MKIVTIDFETEAIENGAPKSPIPVGVSIKLGGYPSKYYSWGHPTENNCTKAEAAAVLYQVYTDPENEFLFHNAKFDVRVLMEHFGWDFPTGRVHDTLFACFIWEPRLKSLSLKPLSDQLLDMPPDEQRELKEWIIENVPRVKAGQEGAHIAKAPGGLVGKYAIGDTDRTKALFDFVYPKLDERSLEAYERERRVLPVVLDMEMTGVPLSPDILNVKSYWNGQLSACEHIIKEKIGDVKLGGKTAFNVMREMGFIHEDKIQYTEKGNPRYGREFLEDLINDEDLKVALVKRSKLIKVLGTYINPWSEAYEKYGRFYPYFNQCRGEDGYGGTRTGRFSSNLQQIPAITDDPDIPNLRVLICPEEGHTVIKSDFSGQELRVAAHYAEGSILEAYKADPELDVHTFVQDLMFKAVNREIPRRVVKTLNFLKIYGGGKFALMKQIGCSEEEAISFFAAYDTALPEFLELSREVEAIGKRGGKIRTWGGRLYGSEPASYVNGKRRDWHYKLANVLIQGSSADMTKEAMVRYFEHPERSGRIMLQVHDELVLSCPPEHVDRDMEILQWAMNEQDNWDVPFVSDQFVGPSFGELKEYKKASK